MTPTQVLMTGQLFYGENKAGPQFAVISMIPGTPAGSFSGRVISHLTGELLAEADGFTSVGEAAEWCFGYSEY